MQHIPVLAKEVLESLQIKPGSRMLDGTVGLGGHALLMLEAAKPNGTLVAIDRDDRNLVVAKETCAKFGESVTYIHDSFGNLTAYDFPKFDAALLDLGFSSVHVDDASRGFSFMNDGPLDMRYDTRQELTAADIVNSWSRDDLATIFRRYGEEPRAQIVAKVILDARREMKIETTGQLAAIVETVIKRSGKMHPATRIFQALRIVVNNELGEVTKGLSAIIDSLAPNGRLAVITFHSLEDRLVKIFFKERSDISILTKRPIVAGREEQKSNPRSRSAKLRIIQKI